MLEYKQKKPYEPVTVKPDITHKSYGHSSQSQMTFILPSE